MGQETLMATGTQPRTRYSFDRYLNARSASFPDFSPDDRFLSFISDITGVPQLWRVPVEGGWPEQLTFTADRVTSGQYAHETPLIVFGMDAGGNEREQLFTLQGPDVGELAVDPAVMHMSPVISWDDTGVAFSDNRRSPAHFDVYIRDIEGGNERCVYEQDGSNFVADWSRDGRYLLISRLNRLLDNDLFRLDLHSGEAVHLTPHDGLAVYESVCFTPDGSSLYLITDLGSEFRRAACMDLRTQEIAFLTPDDHDIEVLALSPSGRDLALVRNLDGYGRLVVRPVDGTEEREAPGLPPGIAAQPVWSHDGNRLAFTYTGPADNPNIWIWDVSGDEARQVTFATGGGIPRDSFVTPELVSFPSFDGLEVPALFYRPPGVERPPVVINVHGGPEGQATPMYSPVIQYFVNRGYAVLAPNVRGSTGYGRTYTHLDDVEKRMDSVADLSAAVEWLRRSGRVDGDRIAVMGGSYGGFMVLAALTTYPDLWAAGVDIVGIANFETFLRNTGAYRRHWRIPEYGDPDRDAELFRRISPIHHVDRIEAPLMVIHGDNDPRVPLSEAEQIVGALRSRGHPVEFMHFPDEGHGVIKLKNKLVAYPAIGAFLDRFLGGER
jgi:dipeptidyl aminopeptidase/acylaminoacyl peptidase